MCGSKGPYRLQNFISVLFFRAGSSVLCYLSLFLPLSLIFRCFHGHRLHFVEVGCCFLFVFFYVFSVLLCWLFLSGILVRCSRLSLSLFCSFLLAFDRYSERRLPVGWLRHYFPGKYPWAPSTDMCHPSSCLWLRIPEFSLLLSAFFLALLCAFLFSFNDAVPSRQRSLVAWLRHCFPGISRSVQASSSRQPSGATVGRRSLHRDPNPSSSCSSEVLFSMFPDVCILFFSAGFLRPRGDRRRLNRVGNSSSVCNSRFSVFPSLLCFLSSTRLFSFFVSLMLAVPASGRRSCGTSLLSG